MNEEEIDETDNVKDVFIDTLSFSLEEIHKKEKQIVYRYL